MANVRVRTNLVKALREGGLGDSLDDAIQATHFIAIREFKEESPVDKGRMRQDTQVIKKRKNYYEVGSAALSDDGAPYPKYLYDGTGKFKGAPDFGYTSGRVRAGEVAFGIGGIRPNKVADRASRKAQSKIQKFVNMQLNKNINKK